MVKTSRVEASWYMIKAKKMRDEGMTLQQIADELGRTHTTIMYYLRKYEDYYAYDKEFRELVKMFREDERPEIAPSKTSVRKVLEVCKKVLKTSDYELVISEIGKVI